MTKPLEQLIISQVFGANPAYYKPLGLAGHEGVDFKTRNLGTSQGWYANLLGWQKVYAVCAGTVTVIYDTKNYGTHIYLQSDDGSRYLYAHLKNARCTSGQRVAEGDLIAISGSSGNANGPHLHLSYRPKNYNVQNGYLGNEDPMKLFSKPFTMDYTVFNGDASIMEQARQLLLKYTDGAIDCSFAYQNVTPINIHGLFTTDALLKFVKEHPIKTRFAFLTYQSDSAYSYMATAAIPQTTIIMTAANPNPTPFNVCFEFSHALSKYLQDHGFAIEDTDLFTPDEAFLKQKFISILPLIKQISV